MVMYTRETATLQSTHQEKINSASDVHTLHLDYNLLMYMTCDGLKHKDIHFKYVQFCQAWYLYRFINTDMQLSQNIAL